MKVHCSVWLSSMFQSAVRMYRPRNNDQASSVADNEPKKTGLQGACPMLLWIRGVIRNNHICPSWMHPLNAYSCIALDCRQMSTSSSLCFEEFISGWFQELLLSLAKECKSLVCGFVKAGTHLFSTPVHVHCVHCSRMPYFVYFYYRVQFATINYKNNRVAVW